MATFTSLGIGSGLDLNNMVTQLVALERAPLKPMQAAATKLQTQVSAFGQMSSLLSTLQDSANKLTDPTLWTQATVSSSDATSVAVSGGSSAALGNFSVGVQALAANQTLVSGTTFAAATDTVGAGTLTLTKGSWNAGQTAFTAGAGPAVAVTLTSTDTVQTLRDKINAAGAGVTATLVTDATGVRLSLRSNDSGVTNGFRLTTADAALAGFAYDPPSGAGGMALTQAATNAKATINGIAVESANNTLDSVVQGLTLQLNKVTSSPVSITAAADKASVQSSIKSFADAFNALAKYIADQTKYDAASKTAGTLQGDSAATSMQKQLRSIVSQASGATTAFAHLSDIGLSLQRDGTLQVNAGKLAAATDQLATLKQAFANTDVATPANNGFARRFADLAQKALGVNGLLTTRKDGLQRLISKNSDDQTALNNRVDLFQQRLVAQYTALDANVAKLNALQGYVTQQIAQMNKSGA